MTRDEVLLFEKVIAQAQGLQEEFSVLTKKKADEPVNKFKLRFVNGTLAELNSFLREGYMPYPDFEQFDFDDVPTVSDVSLILGQYIECAENFRGQNVYSYQGHWYWRLSDDPDRLKPRKTTIPRRLMSRK